MLTALLLFTLSFQGPAIAVCGDGLCQDIERGICASDCGQVGGQTGPPVNPGPLPDLDVYPSFRETGIVAAIVIAGVIFALLIIRWELHRLAWKRLLKQAKEVQKQLMTEN